MTNREGAQAPTTTTAVDLDTVQLDWNSRKEWGAYRGALTHRASTTVGETEYRFVVDRLDSVTWVLRGWSRPQGGDTFRFTVYAQTSTVKRARQGAQDHVDAAVAFGPAREDRAL